MHSRCIWVILAFWSGRSNSIRAAFVRQLRGNLKTPTGIRSAFQMNSLSTENIEIDSHCNRDAFEVHSGHSFCWSGHSKCILTAFEPHSSGNLKIPTVFKVHSGHSCPLVGTFQLHLSRIRAAVERQSKDSDCIRSAFQSAS